MHYVYKPKGTCSIKIEFDIDDDIITNISFLAGCQANLQMIAKLLDGMTASEINEKCISNICGNRGTSCARELAKAVIEASTLEKQTN